MSLPAFLLIVALLGANAASAQQTDTHPRPALASLLNVPEHQWVFNHICVPLPLLGRVEYTNADFIGAYFDVSKLRWEASMAALELGDEKRSMSSLALIIHGVIDLYWPNRVGRDASGAITYFRDCDELGNLQGVLREEKTGSGPSGLVREQATAYVTQVIRKWKERRPFQEVADILSAGPMKFSHAHSSNRLGQK